MREFPDLSSPRAAPETAFPASTMPQAALVGIAGPGFSVLLHLGFKTGFTLRWIHTLWTSPSSIMQITTKVPE